MPETWYVVAVLGIVFAITLALRAVPFAVLTPLRESRLVSTMAGWMPAGILGILALSTFLGSADQGDGHPVQALLAVAVTVAVHLLFNRRTLLSVGAGTATFIALAGLL